MCTLTLRPELGEIIEKSPEKISTSKWEEALKFSLLLPSDISFYRLSHCKVAWQMLSVGARLTDGEQATGGRGMEWSKKTNEVRHEDQWQQTRFIHISRRIIDADSILHLTCFQSSKFLIPILQVSWDTIFKYRCLTFFSLLSYNEHQSKEYVLPLWQLKTTWQNANIKLLFSFL